MSNLEFARAQARDTKIKLHGPDAFAGMQKAGQLVAEALDLLVDEVRPGVTTEALDALVFDFAMAMAPSLRRSTIAASPNRSAPR